VGAVQDVRTVRGAQRSDRCPLLRRGRRSSSDAFERVTANSRWRVTAQPKLERPAVKQLEQVAEFRPAHALAVDENLRPVIWEFRIILIRLFETPGHNVAGDGPAKPRIQGQVRMGDGRTGFGPNALDQCGWISKWSQRSSSR
jgi:hypothetical protein